MRHIITMSLIGAIVSLGCVGCHTGPSASDFRPAMTPYGVHTRLQLRDHSLNGELLEVRDSAFVLYDDAGSGIVLIPFSAVRDTRFEDTGSYGDGAPDAEWAAKLRRLSRYPYGITPSVLQALLTKAHQSELRVDNP